MVAKEISSLQHPLIRRCVELRTERAVRDAEMRLLITGRKYISDLATRWPIEILFFHGAPPSIPALEMISVSLPVFKKISGFEEPDGWAAIVPRPTEQSLQSKETILILDQIRDPGNLGTLWRTALGLGWQGVWLTPGCADPFNDKALRAAQGATFSLAFERILPEEILRWQQKRSAHLYVNQNCRSRWFLAMKDRDPALGPPAANESPLRLAVRLNR
jgi:TrmH family RNA methyltransferase